MTHVHSRLKCAFSNRLSASSVSKPRPLYVNPVEGFLIVENSRLVEIRIGAEVRADLAWLIPR